MIKLTLTPNTQPIVYVFEKNTVTIGKISYNDPVADLALPNDELQAIHLKIEYNGTHFIISNIGEDPFCTLNAFPFARKAIYNGDLLQIGDTLLQFEGIASEVEEILPEEAFPPVQLATDLISSEKEDSITEDPLFIEVESTAHFPSKEEDSLASGSSSQTSEGCSPGCAEASSVANSSANSNASSEKTTFQDTPIDIDDLLFQVSQLEEKFTASVSQKDFNISKKNERELQKETLNDEQTKHSVGQDNNFLDLEEEPSELPPVLKKDIPQETKEPPSQARRKSIKDDLPGDNEEESGASSIELPKFSPPIQISWKAVFSAFGAFFLLISIVMGCFYLALLGHNEEEEIKAAQAVADVAMALNFARINHSKPINHNWSDADFLRHNLHAVLARSYTPLAEVDSHGNLLDTSYLLRIYTGHNLDHFLIIAQPSPSLMQWLVPKAAITVDSNLMELKKISDVKTLNRLLINATLDTSNSEDIAHFVNLGELIPLSELKKRHPHSGFELPKALVYIRPGAENLIYNVARYYPLGESLIKKAISLFDSEEYSADLPALVEEIERFTRFPNILLYSSGGIKMAQKGQEALAAFFPNYRFLHAYIQFNPNNYTSTSHLLMEASSNTARSAAEVDTTPAEGELAINETTLEQKPSEAILPESDLDELLDNYLNEEIEHLAQKLTEKELGDTPLPLYQPFSKDVDQKHELFSKLTTLAQTRSQLVASLLEELESEKDAEKYEILDETYQKAIDEQQDLIIRAITKLQQQYATMPLTQFMNYVKAAGLRPFIQENLRRQLHDANHAPFSEELINSSIEKIRQSLTLTQLEKNLRDTSQMLTLDNFPDPALFIAYQNEIHSTVLHKLDIFLLSNPAPFKQELEELGEQQRQTVGNILQRAWVADEDEFNYYLNEFDLLMPEVAAH